MEDSHRDFIIKDDLLVRYTGNDPVVFVPERVRDIGERAFYGNTSIISVFIPGYVASIRDKAFFECVNLTCVSFSEGLFRIGSKAFAHTNLKYIRIPYTIRFIKEDAFDGLQSSATIQFLGRCPFWPPAIQTAFQSDCPITAYYPEGDATWDFIRTANSTVTWIPLDPQKKPRTELNDILRKEIKTTDEMAFLMGNGRWKEAFEAAVRDIDNQLGLRDFYRSFQKGQTDSSGYYLYDGSGGSLEITINFLRMVINSGKYWQLKYDEDGCLYEPEDLELDDERADRVLSIPFYYACTDRCGDVWQNLNDIQLEEGIKGRSDDLICIRESSQDVPGKYTIFIFDVSYEVNGCDIDGELRVCIYGYEFPERHVTGQDE